METKRRGRMVAIPKKRRRKRKKKKKWK